MPSQDPSGWQNFCVKCRQWIWFAWIPSAAKAKHVELDRETPHVCQQ